MAKIIKNEGLKPMCFNDGIYYNSKDNQGKFDTDIIISYWTAGWSGFNVAKPYYLADKGHKILNTNDVWYWVLGNISSGGYKYEDTIKNIEAKDFNDVTGANGRVIQTIGSMQAVWCDAPQKEHDMPRIMDLMDRFSTKHASVMIRPADYSKVETVLKKVPENLSIYTDETRRILETAISEIDYTKKVTEQTIVDGYATKIEDAISGLVLKSADYSKVDEAIKKANSLNKDLYKDFSAVTKAIDAVKRDLDITKQDEVDAMAKSILQAIDALVEKPIVKPDDPETKPVVPENNNKPNNTPITSDTTNIIALASLFLASSAVLAILVKKRKDLH